MTTTQRGIITLLRSAITGEKLALPEDFSWEEADPVIRSQSLLPLVYQGAYHCGIPMDTELMQRYKNQYFRCLMRSEQQMRAVEAIYRAFEENGIDYLPLKGCILKELYPQPEMRIMGDADILIRVEQYDRIRQILPELGYGEKGESHHELVWTSEKLYLELHKYLIAKVEKDFYPYFRDGWGLAVKQEGHRFALREEDVFVFLFTHMTKHYRASGIGARHILDLYVFRRAYPGLEETYIEKAMQKLHLLEFYCNIRRLLAVWFENAPSDEKTEFISSYILSGGNWGDLETRMRSDEVKRMGQSDKPNQRRLKSITAAVFPPLEKLQYDYRILFKYPFLYPLFWVPRWIKGILCRPGEIWKKMTMLGSMTDEKVTQRQKDLNYVGLDYNF